MAEKGGILAVHITGLAVSLGTPPPEKGPEFTVNVSLGGKLLKSSAAKVFVPKAKSPAAPGTAPHETNVANLPAGLVGYTADAKASHNYAVLPMNEDFLFGLATERVLQEHQILTFSVSSSSKHVHKVYNLQKPKDNIAASESIPLQSLFEPARVPRSGWVSCTTQTLTGPATGLIKISIVLLYWPKVDLPTANATKAKPDKPISALATTVKAPKATLTLFRNHFFPGERVSGIIMYNRSSLREVKPPDGARLVINGMQVIHPEENSAVGTYVVPLLNIPVPLTFPNKKVEALAASMPGSDKPKPGPYNIDAGRYLWHFELDLPTTLPPSLRTMFSTTNYFLLLQCPGRRGPTGDAHDARQGFVVTPRLPPQFLPKGPDQPLPALYFTSSNKISELRPDGEKKVKGEALTQTAPGEIRLTMVLPSPGYIDVSTEDKVVFTATIENFTQTKPIIGAKFEVGVTLGHKINPLANPDYRNVPLYSADLSNSNASKLLPVMPGLSLVHQFTVPKEAFQGFATFVGPAVTSTIHAALTVITAYDQAMLPMAIHVTSPIPPALQGVSQAQLPIVPAAKAQVSARINDSVVLPSPLYWFKPEGNSQTVGVPRDSDVYNSQTGWLLFKDETCLALPGTAPTGFTLNGQRKRGEATVDKSAVIPKKSEASQPSSRPKARRTNTSKSSTPSKTASAGGNGGSGGSLIDFSEPTQYQAVKSPSQSDSWWDAPEQPSIEPSSDFWSLFSQSSSASAAAVVGQDSGALPYDFSAKFNDASYESDSTSEGESGSSDEEEDSDAGSAEAASSLVDDSSENSPRPAKNPSKASGLNWFDDIDPAPAPTAVAAPVSQPATPAKSPSKAMLSSPAPAATSKQNAPATLAQASPSKAQVLQPAPATPTPANPSSLDWWAMPDPPAPANSVAHAALSPAPVATAPPKQVEHVRGHTKQRSSSSPVAPKPASTAKAPEVATPTAAPGSPAQKTKSSHKRNGSTSSASSTPSKQPEKSWFDD